MMRVCLLAIVAIRVVLFLVFAIPVLLFICCFGESIEESMESK